MPRLTFDTAEVNKDYTSAVNNIATNCKYRVVKKMTHRNAGGTLEGDFLGYGHFKWDYQVHTLTPIEIQAVKDFFYN